MISIKGELANLLEQRLAFPGKINEIDQQIRSRFIKTYAIMIIDSCQFSYKTSKYGIINYLSLILSSHKIIFPIIEKYQDIMLKAEADNVNVIFPTVELALSAGIEINKALEQRDKPLAEKDQYSVCMAIGYGEVIHHENEIFGDEVNATYLLGEDIANKNEILLTCSANIQIASNSAFETSVYKDLELSKYCLKCFRLEY
jgi:hypothetical protein